MTDWRIIRGKIERFAAHYKGPLFHALLCDPPYELGFMGKNWDKSGIAFNPDTWTALAEHLLPGAFGMAFASARGWHRLAVAIEDAGMRIHPSIFGWSYGSGFPKATRIKNAPQFTGYRYGLQAMKPALEPIIVFQKPYTGCPVDCITETGAGALNIDDGRIGGSWERRTPTIDDIRGDNYSRSGGKRLEVGPQESHPQGRWPANFVLQHTPFCERVGTRLVGSGLPKLTKRPRGEAWREMEGRSDRLGQVEALDSYGEETIDAWRCMPECPVRRLGEQSEETTSKRANRGRGFSSSGSHPGWQRQSHNNPAYQHIVGGYDDKGTAARFFFQSDWSYEIAERLALADPVRYVAKASRRERDAGLDGFGTLKHTTMSGAHINKPEHQCSDGAKRTGIRQIARNPHPTVKPIALVRWLATLLLPPAEYAPRRIIVPFCGVASEMIGAGLAGWDVIIGVDTDKGYCEIGDSRMAYWMAKPEQIPLMED